MVKQSAGILLYRWSNGLEVFLIHPGGPFFVGKDAGAWSVPKGEYSDEDPLMAAIREFKEETGQDVTGEFIALAAIKQKSGKVVLAWALEGDMDPEIIVSNTFEMIWPPKSQKLQSFPEVDRASWFTIDIAKQKINIGQVPLLDELEKLVNAGNQ